MTKPTNDERTEYLADTETRAEARRLTEQGYCVVPIPAGEKGPRRKKWNELRLTVDDIDREFIGDSNIGIILGEPSDWLVDVDLDCKEAVRLAPDFLPETGCITGREGRERSHWWYVCEGAENYRPPDPVDKSSIVELRANGLQTVVGPSVHPEGGRYDCLAGEPAAVSHDELRDSVERLRAAVLAERGHEEPVEPTPKAPEASRGSSDTSKWEVMPGDDYSENGDLHSFILSKGWQVAGKGADGNILLTRPGKQSGTSASYKDGVFYLYSSSVPGFEPGKGYSPFEVYTRIAHNGEHKAAANDLANQGFGKACDYGVDLSGLDRGVGVCSSTATPDTLVAQSNEDTVCAAQQIGPEPFPEHLLNVPGFIGEHLDYTLSVAHAQQPVLTLFAGICLQAALAGRKVTDPYGNQKCLYVAALALTGSGKDKPRAVNSEILASIGSKVCGPEDIASDAGLNTLLAEQPASLLQIDEFGRFLKAIAIGGERSPHLYKINTAFLRLYSSIGRMYRPNAYGDSKKNVEINHPCPVIYGSTVPDSFWGAMTSESMTDGLLARLIPIVGEEKPRRCIAKSKPIPRPLLDHAQDWDRRTCGDGNMTSTNPAPEVIEYTPDAEQFAIDYAMRNNELIDSGSEWRGLYARSFEKAARLALVYAASRSVESPQIDLEAIQWATEVIDWSNSLFVTVGSLNIADTEFERTCQKTYQAIKRHGRLSNRDLGRHCRPYARLPVRSRDEVIQLLYADGKIDFDPGERGGRIFFAI